MHRLAGLALHIRFESNHPGGHIHGNDCCTGIRTRVNDALDLLTVPGHHEGDLSALAWIRPPITVPGPGQRMSLLREIRRGDAQAHPEATQLENAFTHGRIIPLSERDRTVHS